MKTKYYLLALAASALLLAGCGPSEDYSALAVGSHDLDYHTDWAAYGLLGPVESVTYVYENGNSTMNFSPKGKELNGIFERSRFKGRTRTVETSYMVMITYKFDDLGRVVSENASDYNTQYEYEGDAYYPKKSVSEYWEIGDEEPTREECIFEYKASDFDSHGNWLVRKRNGEKEKRVITYHADPYDLGPAPHYKSAVEVTKAILKAEKNLDAKAYLQTCEYSVRKRYELRVDKYQDRFDGRKEEYRIKSFRVSNDVEEKRNGKYEVSATITFGNGNVEEWGYLVYQGDDGYWYNGLLAAQK